MDKICKFFGFGNNKTVETPPQLRMKSYDYKDLIKEALKEAILSGVPNFKYIDKIVYEWNKNGIKKK